MLTPSVSADHELVMAWELWLINCMELGLLRLLLLLLLLSAVLEPVATGAFCVLNHRPGPMASDLHCLT